MIQTIYVKQKSENDPHLLHLLTEMKQRFSKSNTTNISQIKVYRLEGITKKQALKLAEEVFCEEITQKYNLNKLYKSKGEKRIEIRYKTGVMNPQIESIKKVANDMQLFPVAIDTATVYIFKTDLQDKNKIASELNLFNPLVQELVSSKPTTLLTSGEIGRTATINIRNMSDSELILYAKDKLFLSLAEMKTIKNYYTKLDRDPTDCELEVLAQTWSEHCIHKTFKANLMINGKKKKSFFSRIKSTAKYKKNIVSAFVDNAGIIDFYDGYAICGKVETHNSPSAIEPYGGAMTGSGGVFRDILGTGLGAKPIVSTDVFCLAPFDLPKSQVPPGCLHPKYILTNVINGVRDYGNRVGIPTNNGSLHFHEDFRAKPTVAVGAYGILPNKYALKQSLQKGFLLLTLGGRTGKDGIHGATFSSAEMTGKTKSVSQTAVQIGNAIEEKRLIDAVLVLRDNKLIKSITDCGAGGFSSAIGEMAEKTGANVYLDRVPLKYKSISPWEIFVSESQERMVIAIDPKSLPEVIRLCKLHNVNATVIGEITASQKLKVFYKTELVCDLAMDFLHNGYPKKTLIGKSQAKAEHIKKKTLTKNHDLAKVWLKILAHPTIASKEKIVRMYDHNVQGTNALHPYSGVNFDGPNDGSVVRPILNKPYGFVTAHGLNPTVMKHDAYWGSIWAITEAISNYVSIGASVDDAALIDNFIWPTPDSDSLFKLDRSVDACTDMAKILSMPFVSGKDSLSSTYRYPDGSLLKIPPVLLISVFGKIPDVKRTLSSDLKQHDTNLFLLGNMDYKNMLGSIYSEVTITSSGEIPRVDLKKLKPVLNKITTLARNGEILSCHDISEGGILTAVTEMCVGGDMGAVLTLNKIKSYSPEQLLFNETPGTFIVELQKSTDAKKIFGDTPYLQIGKTTVSKEIMIKNKNEIIAIEKLTKLKDAWQKPFRKIFP